MSERPLICLNMIVKNEAKIITRVLESVKDWIDYWAILDTGSTDDTQNVILNFFKKHNIQGELHSHIYSDKYKCISNSTVSLVPGNIISLNFPKITTYKVKDFILVYYNHEIFGGGVVLENKIVGNISTLKIKCLRSTSPQQQSEWFVCLLNKNASLADTNEFTFADARNKSLDFAKAAMAKKFSNKRSYILLIDADMIFIVYDKFWREKLTGDIYEIVQGDILVYPNRRLVRSDLNSKYMLGTHEYLWTEVSCSGILPKDMIRMGDKEDGSNRTVKFDRDLEILLHESIKYPGDERANFYLGQTYEGRDNNLRALDCYKIVINVKGVWDEHKYISLLRLGRIYKKLFYKTKEEKYGSLSVDCHIEAFKVNPNRCESIAEIERFYRSREPERNSSHISYNFAKWAASIKYPTIQKASLFMEKYIYDFLLDIDFAKSCDEIGDLDTLKKCINRILLVKECNNSAKNEIINFVRKVIKLLSSENNTKELKVSKKFDENHYLLNPSILILKNGTTFISVREVNYFFVIDENRYISDGTIRTYTHVIKYNLFQKEEYLIDQPNENLIKLYPNPVSGLEDVRLFENQNTIYGIATSRITNPNNVNEMVLLNFNENFTLKKITRLFPHERDLCQKNWAPMEGPNNELLFIYSYDPLIILKPDLDTGNCEIFANVEQDLNFKEFRGSSQAIKYKDGWLIVVHEVYFNIKENNTSRLYFHRFLWFDKNYKISKISEQFIFRNITVEYCAGMAIDEDWIYVTYGYEDKVAYITKLRHEELEKMWLNLEHDKM